jgi:hypothetical protein
LKTTTQVASLRSFFLIAFLFSWILWAPQVLSHFGLIHAHFSPVGPLQLLGTFGPTVGALVTAARERGALRQLVFSFSRMRLPLRWYAASLFIPLAVYLGASAIRAVVLHSSLHITLGRIPSPSFLHSGGLATFMIVAGFAMGVFLFAAAEEIGWRGFALPRLVSTLGFLPGASVFPGLDVGTLASSSGLYGWQSASGREFPHVCSF